MAETTISHLMEPTPEGGIDQIVARTTLSVTFMDAMHSILLPVILLGYKHREESWGT